MRGRHALGPNTLVVEGDTIFLKSVGPFLLSAAQEYVRIAEQVLTTHGVVYFVTDLSAAAMMPPPSRRFLAEWARHHQAAAVIYYGTSLPLRAVAQLLLSAARLFAGGKHAVELFVNSEAEARATIGRLKETRQSI